MEDSMLVEFNSRFAKKKQDLICDVIAFGSDKLFPEFDDVFINISGIRKQGVFGDCMYEDDNEFTIRLDLSLSIPDLITTVLHELVHVKQYLNCMVMDTDSPYEQRWQEIEAHAMDKELTEAFNGQTRPN
jgi:hypothetical protein